MSHTLSRDSRAVLSAALVGTAMGSNHVVPAFLRGAQNDVGAHVETNVCDLVWHYCRMGAWGARFARRAALIRARRDDGVEGRGADGVRRAVSLAAHHLRAPSQIPTAPTTR